MQTERERDLNIYINIYVYIYVYIYYDMKYDILKFLGRRVRRSVHRCARRCANLECMQLDARTYIETNLLQPNQSKRRHSLQH